MLEFEKITRLTELWESDPADGLRADGLAPRNLSKYLYTW